jgi:hypothetical protein
VAIDGRFTYDASFFVSPLKLSVTHEGKGGALVYALTCDPTNKPMGHKYPRPPLDRLFNLEKMIKISNFKIFCDVVMLHNIVDKKNNKHKF